LPALIAVAAWSSLPIPFSARDATQVPEHWRTFGQRSSLLSKGPRLATNPAGAILNYLYSLVEAETILACHAVGLDPGVGIFHVDQRDRGSLALDLMEAVRPLVDSYVLALLTQRTLSARDFVETRQGACRLKPRLAGQVAETLPAWGTTSPRSSSRSLMLWPRARRHGYRCSRHSPGTTTAPRGMNANRAAGYTAR
jgi:hypothetical protein